MGIGVAVDGAGGLFLVSIPWFGLAIAAWRGRRIEHARPATARLGVMTLPQSQSSDPSVDAERAADDGAFEMAVDVPVLSAREQEEGLVIALEAAKAARDDVVLSSQSVKLARLMLVRSERTKAAQLLQAAALAALRAKLPVVHAEARLELAELALLDNDLTSACEHWQMAKLMFHDMGQRADQDRVADLMRQQRCPTDWILTNF